MTSRVSKRQDSPSRAESLEKLLAEKVMVIKNVHKIRQSIVHKTIFLFNEARMSIGYFEHIY